MSTVIEFDNEKATQALNFFAQKEGGSISKLKAVKLIWLADRYHLRHYGRPITNDTYCAMKFGPVGSSVKDFAECSDFLSTEERSYLKKFISSDRANNLVISKKQVDTDVLSATDLEALNTVYQTFGKLSPTKLVKYSHDYPEWSKFKTQLESGGSTCEVMSYTDFFANPTNQDDPFFKESPSKLKATKEAFLDNFAVASFWLAD